MIYFASFKQACDWADAQLGQTGCDLPRLLGMALEPWFWVEPLPDGSRDGYWARIAIARDERAPDITGSHVLVGEYTGFDGIVTVVRPRLPVQIAALRFLRPELMAAVHEAGAGGVQTVQPELHQHAADSRSEVAPVPGKPQIDYSLLAPPARRSGFAGA
jgi:hypothetical protein